MWLRASPFMYREHPERLCRLAEYCADRLIRLRSHFEIGEVEEAILIRTLRRSVTRTSIYTCNSISCLDTSAYDRWVILSLIWSAITGKRLYAADYLQ